MELCTSLLGAVWVGVRFVVGEWSLGTCGMWGSHPHTLSDPDFLYTWHASATSSFVSHGAEADFFWSATVRAGGHDQID